MACAGCMKRRKKIKAAAQTVKNAIKKPKKK